MSNKMKNTVLEAPSLSRALDTYGNLNCLIDSGLNEIIKWCAKSTKNDTKKRYVFSLKNLDYVLEHLSTEVLVTIKVTPLEDDNGSIWCWMLTKSKKKRICF